MAEYKLLKRRPKGSPPAWMLSIRVNNDEAYTEFTIRSFDGTATLAAVSRIHEFLEGFENSLPVDVKVENLGRSRKNRQDGPRKVFVLRRECNCGELLALHNPHIIFKQQ